MKVSYHGPRLGVLLLLGCSLHAQSPQLAQRSHLAKQLMDAGKFEQAIPIYRELVHALPKNPGFLTNLGLAMDMAGHKREAVRAFEASLRLDPHQLPALLFLGAAYLDLGEPARAVDPLAKLLKLQPDNLDAEETLAEALLALGRLEPAVEHFEKSAQADPQSPKVWHGLGLSYESLAQQDFDQLAKVAPGSAYWLDLVADSRLKVLQYNSAFFLYRQALAKMPLLRGAHAAVAEIYKGTGHADWASAEEQKENLLPPADCGTQILECAFSAGRLTDLVARAARLQTPESYYWRTRAYNQLALQAFAHLGGLPPSAELHELLGKTKFDRRQYSDAIQEWQEALKLSPGSPYVQKELALSLMQNKDFAGALPTLRTLARQNRGSAELNYMLGDTLLNVQKVNEAIPYLKKAVTTDPHLLPAHAALARAYLQVGQALKAVPHLKAALPIDDDGSLHYQLARAYESSGHADLAPPLLRDYQAIVKASAAENQATAQEVQILPPEPAIDIHN